MKTLPASVQVGPLRYRVTSEEAVRARHAAECRNKNQWDLAGSADHLRGVIHVGLGEPGAEDWSPDQVADTLLHEVLHAVWRQTAECDEELAKYEEQIVRHLTPLLLDTLRRNPELVAYLVEQDE